MGVCAPSIIFSIYFLLAIPLSGQSLEKSYKELIAFGVILLAMATNYVMIANECHNGNEFAEIFLKLNVKWQQISLVKKCLVLPV